MWFNRFLATGLAVLAFFVFTESRIARSAVPASDSQIHPPHAIAGSDWVRVAETKAKTKKPVENKPEKEEPGIISKTLSKLMGDDKDKAAEKDSTKKATKGSKAETEKNVDTQPEKEEPGLLTRALKKLVGGDEDKKETQNNPLNPINVAPTVSATKKMEEDQKSKTAKSETKATLKSSFKKLIGVDAAKDKAKASVAKTAKQEDSGVMSTFKKILGGGDKKEKPAAGKPAGKAPPADTKQAKKDSGGLLEGIMGDGDQKKTSAASEKQAQADQTEAPGTKPVSGSSRKYLGQQGEEEQLEEDRGGVKKGKNILKESFKILVKDDKKKEDDEE